MTGQQLNVRFILSLNRVQPFVYLCEDWHVISDALELTRVLCRVQKCVTLFSVT